MYRLLYLLLIPFGFFVYNKLHLTNHYKPALPFFRNVSKPIGNLSRLKDLQSSLLTYTKNNGFNSSYAFVIDMKEHSGNNRFYVYDLQKDSVLSAGMVTHGYGNNSRQAVAFSNVPGSNCSSLGHYKIGKSYNGRFGLAFKLYGLDKTNSNAFNRFVVLHSHPCVPDNEVYPSEICMSQGCPTVSPAYLKTLKNYIERSSQPVLLYIFY